MQLPPLSKALLSATVSFILIADAYTLPSIANSNSSHLARQGLPGRRISGGVREGNCFKDFNQSLVAIMPRNNLGKTVSARPTFWFSIPETNGKKEIEFQLFDGDDEMVYSSFVEVSDEQGLSEFQLPASATELTIDETYRWTFAIGCTDSSQFVVQGWVQRVAMPNRVSKQFETASPEEQAALYSSAGLWYDEITTLVNLRRQDLNNADFQMAWAELLASAGLTSHVSSNITEEMTAVETSSLSASY